MAVSALGRRFFDHSRKCFLCCNLVLYCFVGCFDGFDHFSFGHFLHFAFHHSDRIGRCTDHKVYIGIRQLALGGVDYELAADTRHAHLGNGSVERYVGNSQGRRCGKSCQRIRHGFVIVGKQLYYHLCFGMIVRREHRAQYAVYQTRYEYFFV